MKLTATTMTLPLSSDRTVYSDIVDTNELLVFGLVRHSYVNVTVGLGSDPGYWHP